MSELVKSVNSSETLQALKKFGECDWETRTQWCDYSGFPCDDQHISELLEILRSQADGDFDEDYWILVHAWRILSVNQIERAVPVIVDLLTNIDDDDDWAMTELPEIIASFGGEVIPSIRKELLESTLHRSGVWGSIGLVNGLGKVAQADFEVAGEVVKLLMQVLTDFEVQSPTLNAFLVSELVNLGDPAALPLIQQVFARKFLDESVLDWPFVRDKFSGVEGLPETIKFEKYDINEFRYNGDERFQKLLNSLDSAFNIEDLKCYILGSQLAIDLVKPSEIIDDVLTNLLHEEIEIETEGQGLYFYREFFSLWNHLCQYHTKPLELFEIDVNELIDNGGKFAWGVKLLRLQWQLVAFLDGLKNGNTEGHRLRDADAADFMLKIEDKVDALGTLKDDLLSGGGDVSVAQVLFNETQAAWSAGYAQFAKACLEARVREIERLKFLDAHKSVGRNDSCPCGSGLKFKKCCLAKAH